MAAAIMGWCCPPAATLDELIVMDTNNNGEGPQRRTAPGRPSVAKERRTQIIDAFLSLVAERGTATVTIAEIAERAGVHRSAVHHFVGNRADLVAAAVHEICEQHDRSRERSIGTAPSLDEVVDYYFCRAYVWDHAELDDVFAILLGAATDDEAIASSIAEDYRNSMDEILELLGRNDAAARAAAYQVICLAEHNVVLQRMSFDPELGDATRMLA
ncbi:MAG: TetR/AcrR family transcriptional regulator, partial [Actinomycetota bacterium]